MSKHNNDKSWNSESIFQNQRLDISVSKEARHYFQATTKSQLQNQRDYREGSLGGKADTLAFTKIIGNC